MMSFSLIAGLWLKGLSCLICHGEHALCVFVAHASYITLSQHYASCCAYLLFVSLVVKWGRTGQRLHQGLFVLWETKNKN